MPLAPGPGISFCEVGALREALHWRLEFAVPCHYAGKQDLSVASRQGPALINFHRMLGLFAFLYGCLDFLTPVWFDKFFDIEDL